MNGNLRKVAIALTVAICLGWIGWVTSGRISSAAFEAQGNRWTETDALRQEISMMKLINENQSSLKSMSAFQGRMEARIDKIETQLQIIASDIVEIKLSLARHQTTQPKI